MITVYAAHNFPPHLKGSGNTGAHQGIGRDFRVIWALEELTLPYTFHWMDISKGEQRLEPNRSINPFGKFPSMTDGEVKLFESAAIVHYLYEKAARLPAQPAARAHLLQWMFAAVNTIESPFVDIFRWDLFWAGRAGRDVRYPELIEMAQTRLADLERALGAKPYLFEEGFGPADILVVTSVNFAQHQPLAFEKAAGARAYLARCRARPAYRRALAKQGLGPGTKSA